MPILSHDQRVAAEVAIVNQDKPTQAVIFFII